MSSDDRLSRRRLLATVGTVVGATAVGGAGFVVPAQAASSLGAWAGTESQNGWPVLDGTTVKSHRIEGSNATAILASGDVATVLLHVARRFHYEINTLDRTDVQGHRADRTITASFESNYLSGTAIVIQAGRYPLGSSGNLFPRELVTIRDILGECGGVVRWGGDDKQHPTEGHFQIDVPPGDQKPRRLAREIRGWRDRPGMGAGALIDPLEPTRRSVAESVRRLQRPAS